jgi:hypothetical protein
VRDPIVARIPAAQAEVASDQGQRRREQGQSSVREQDDDVQPRHPESSLRNTIAEEDVLAATDPQSGRRELRPETGRRQFGRLFPKNLWR